MVKMRCEECGWVYEPEKGFPASNIPPGTPWMEVSTDFVCPICGAGKERFLPKED
ncbi:MAG: rubredoxin [Planctomycetaceae bacterium]|nr:rubredoxin [Planctomycetaceae bacterium]